MHEYNPIVKSFFSDEYKQTKLVKCTCPTGGRRKPVHQPGQCQDARKQYSLAMDAFKNNLPNVPFPDTLTIRNPKAMGTSGLSTTWSTVGQYAVKVETDWPHKRKAGLDITVMPVCGGDEDEIKKMYRGVESEQELRGLINACVNVLRRGEKPTIRRVDVSSKQKLLWAMQKKGLEV